MRCLSATDVAIAFAIRNRTLKVEERPSRFPGETFIALSDMKGLIEVQVDMAAATARIADITGRIEAP